MNLANHIHLKLKNVFKSDNMLLFGIFVTILMLIIVPELSILFLSFPAYFLYLYISDSLRFYRNGAYERKGKEPPFWCKWFKK